MSTTETTAQGIRMGKVRIEHGMKQEKRYEKEKACSDITSLSSFRLSV